MNHAYYGDLYRWIGVQRRQYNNDKTKFTNEQITILESIPRWPNTF